MKILNTKVAAESLKQGEVTRVSVGAFMRCFWVRYTINEARKDILRSLIGRSNIGGYSGEDEIWMPAAWLDNFECLCREVEARHQKAFQHLKAARRQARKDVGDHRQFSGKALIRTSRRF